MCEVVFNSFLSRALVFLWRLLVVWSWLVGDRIPVHFSFDARQGETPNIQHPKKSVSAVLFKDLSPGLFAVLIPVRPVAVVVGQDVAACCAPPWSSTRFLCSSITHRCRYRYIPCIPDGPSLPRTWSPCPCAMDPNCHRSTLGTARRTSNSSTISARGCMRTSSRSASSDASTR